MGKLRRRLITVGENGLDLRPAVNQPRNGWTARIVLRRIPTMT